MMLKENEVFVYKTSPSYEELEADSEIFRREYLANVLNVITPCDKVVIKPNFVKESHLYKPGEWDYVITHPTVIKIILEEVVKRLDGSGEVYIVDAPQTDSDYDLIMKETHLPEMIAEIQKTTDVKIYTFDLREERWYNREGIIVRKKKLPGDPKGYVNINLEDKSEFFGKICKEYYGADYDIEETRKYHNNMDNIYVMSRTILSADVFINVPKMKTHKLAGVTLSLKNLVGTCVIKNSIPHHTLGTPETGGDKFKYETVKNKSESALKGVALQFLKSKNPAINYPFIIAKKIAGFIYGSAKSETIRNGMWYGNDTIWRSVLDLNKILFYADKNGVMQDEVQRKYISIIDGVIGGEGNGPMEPDKKESGTIVIGINPVTVDIVGTAIMGFDYKKIPSIINATKVLDYTLLQSDISEIQIVSNYNMWCSKIKDLKRENTLCYTAHFGWTGHIEIV